MANKETRSTLINHSYLTLSFLPTKFISNQAKDHQCAETCAYPVSAIDHTPGLSHPIQSYSLTIPHGMKKPQNPTSKLHISRTLRSSIPTYREKQQQQQKNCQKDPKFPVKETSFSKIKRTTITQDSRANSIFLKQNKKLNNLL